MDRFRGRLRRERDSLPRQTGRPRSLRRGGALRFPSPRPALGRAGLARGAAWLDFPPPLRTRCLESGGLWRCSRELENKKHTMFQHDGFSRAKSIIHLCFQEHQQSLGSSTKILGSGRGNIGLRHERTILFHQAIHKRFRPVQATLDFWKQV
ncbi:uncharacterized protein LOC104331006 isoform X2 [Opisthocomus hoazin]|uniref:uncharacterized protein LOC104331006 isoform X2 n=1 Tax=Opisthocomus hoazin TaxID=30419 RepID=UPI003F53646C